MLFDVWLRDGEEQMNRLIKGHKVRLHAGSVYTFDLPYGRDSNTGADVPEIRGAGGQAQIIIAGLAWRESKYRKPLDPGMVTTDRVQSWRAGGLRRILTKIQKRLKDEFGPDHYRWVYDSGEKVGRGTGIAYVVEAYNDLVDEKDRITDVPPLDPPAPEGIRAFGVVFKGKSLDQIEATTCSGPEGSGRPGCGLLFDTVKEMSNHNRTAHNLRKNSKSNRITGEAPPQGMPLHEEVI